MGLCSEKQMKNFSVLTSLKKVSYFALFCEFGPSYGGCYLYIGAFIKMCSL